MFLKNYAIFRLAPLTCPPAAANPSTFAALTTPGGFAHYVRLRHHRSSLLAGASNALTFVRGADRACCAPRKWPVGLLYCVNGFADRPRLACTGSPHAPRRGIGVRTRQRHLAARACCAPHKWPLGLLYCVNGFADRPRPACTGRPHAPRRGIGVRTRQRHLAAAPGSGTLPPHGQKKTSSCVRSNLR